MIAFNVLDRGWPCARPSVHHLIDLMYAYTVWRQDSLEAARNSGGFALYQSLSAVVRHYAHDQKAGASCLIKPNDHLIWKKANIEIVD